MTDKTAREAAQSAAGMAHKAHERIDEAVSKGGTLHASHRAEIRDLNHKFDLLMEFLNAEEVTDPEIPAVPARDRIQKVKK